jgi:hypothetical protein
MEGELGERAREEWREELGDRAREEWRGELGERRRSCGKEARR